ncbi:hypothetical protein G6O69_08700 [Pseudenhygromyxa sp. WMMC2535]|uniref:hypothetical protein n=1 Tax=Pseudenhygromyxa sp. WMMC2535 TaxID=2712867 RepID=UPI001552141B|nr:hypothetical protein [Pseudenhygromyxa sp. WMMC2535]NVB37912.1 hypothetical protein [Pseudenhygromyxa sp. WMMC2535]
MRPILRALLISASLAVPTAAVSLSPTTAMAAGPESEEIWFGTGVDSLETDDNGKLTAEGAATKTDEVDRIPGEDDWELKLHARMGKYAAPGPAYTEFYQTVNGEEYIVYRHEDPNYEGSRLYTTTILLESNIGFNKNREYRVQIVQNNGKRDLVVAKGKVTLVDTGREAPEAEDAGEDEDEDEDEDDDLDEDEDDLGEDDEDEDDGASESSEAPPPIDPPAKKKGCSVAELDTNVGFSGTAILLLLALGIRRRRED